MYDTLWQTIQAGDYRLAEMLHRIDVFYGEGKLTDQERGELQASARSNADPEEEYPADWREPFESLSRRLEELTATVETNAAGMAALKEAVEQLGASVEEPEPEPGEEWPEYVAPTGAHDAYYNGAKITYNGKHYTCIAPEGIACVWPPDVYPAYWRAED